MPPLLWNFERADGDAAQVDAGVRGCWRSWMWPQGEVPVGVVQRGAPLVTVFPCCAVGRIAAVLHYPVNRRHRPRGWQIIDRLGLVPGDTVQIRLDCPGYRGRAGGPPGTRCAGMGLLEAEAGVRSRSGRRGGTLLGGVRGVAGGLCTIYTAHTPGSAYCDLLRDRIRRGEKAQNGRWCTPVRCAIIGVIAQLLLAEIAPCKRRR